MVDIRQSTLRAYQSTLRLSDQPGGIAAAKSFGRQTAFLCHSHLDRRLALSLQAFLHAQGWRVYIDWQDQTLPSTPDRRTAETIQDKIRQLDWLLYLATVNSAASRWCPWEIGYADGIKSRDRIVVIPTRDEAGASYGSEYMELYRRIEEDAGAVSVFEPGRYSGRRIDALRL